MWLKRNNKFMKRLIIPDTSRLINIHTGEYASLGDWYNNVKVKENEVELKNDYDGKSMVLRDVKGLDWIYITKEKNNG